MKIYTLILTVALTTFFGACGAGTETKKADAKDSKATTENKEETKKETPSSSAMTPTETVKAFIAAYQKKDVEAFKKLVSKKSLAEMEKAAKAEKETLDKKIEELLADEKLPFKGEPEMRNEKIDGDKASVEVKIEDKWENTPLVKEDGVWKFTFEN